MNNALYSVYHETGSFEAGNWELAVTRFRARADALALAHAVHAATGRSVGISGPNYSATVWGAGNAGPAAAHGTVL